MFDRLRGAYHWLKALAAYRRDDDPVALEHATMFARLDPRGCDYHIAFRATLLVACKRSDEAELLFEAVAFGRVRRGVRVADPTYVREYALCYLALINETGAEIEHWQAATARPVSRFARRYLPLTNPTPLNE